jgi:hypothetical protein
MPRGSKHPHALPIPEHVLKDWDEPDLDIHLAPRKQPAFNWCCRAGSHGRPGCGHRWKARLLQRINYKNGCPRCAVAWRTRAIPDLLRREWVSEVPIDQANRSKKFPWVCSTCSHRWSSSITIRIGGRGCRKCGTQRASLKRRQYPVPPHVLADWDSPTPIEQASRKAIWPFVHRGSQHGEKPCGGKWSARLWARIGKMQTGCPHCAQPGRKSEEN